MRAKEELPECPVATAVSLIGGKWKLLILRNLKERPWRFNELQRSIDGISQKVLTDSLRVCKVTQYPNPNDKSSKGQIYLSIRQKTSKDN